VPEGDLPARAAAAATIAQAVFVTSKTVETHLRAVYRKLHLTGRTQLPDVLARHGPVNGLAGRAGGVHETTFD